MAKDTAEVNENTRAQRLDSSERSQELKKMDTAAKNCVARLYECWNKSEFFQEVTATCVTFGLAKLMMEFFGKGRYLPTDVLLYGLAVQLCIDVSRFYRRKLAEKRSLDK